MHESFLSRLKLWVSRNFPEITKRRISVAQFLVLFEWPRGDEHPSGNASETDSIFMFLVFWNDSIR